MIYPIIYTELRTKNIAAKIEEDLKSVESWNYSSITDI